MIKNAKSLFIALPLVVLAAGTDESIDPGSRFDAEAGWGEFERLLRSHYAYLERLGEESVERQLERSRNVAASAKTPEELRRIMHRTALTFMDPHLIVGPFEAKDYAIIYSGADLRATYEDGRYEVSEVRRDSAASRAGVRPGWRILAIDGVDAGQAARLPFGRVLHEPTGPQLSYGITLAANGLRGQKQRSLSFAKPGGTTAEIEMPVPFTRALGSGSDKLVSLERVGDDGQFAHVLIHNSLGENETITAFDKIMRQIADADGVIIDLRDTPSGGNTDVARSIIGHFLTTPTPYQVHTIPAVKRELGVPRRFVELASPRLPHFAGPLVVLHGSWTGSMGEGLAIGLDAAAGAYTIGSDMGDLLGALWNFDLAISGARLDMGVERLFHPEGQPREDYVADLPAAYGDIDPDGRDPLLPIAIRHLENIAGADRPQQFGE